MGTELQRAGLAIGECGEHWSLMHPDRLHAIHGAYIAAGSQAIITNSFGANRWVLGRYGLDAQVEAINRAAAALRRRAAGAARVRARRHRPVRRLPPAARRRRSRRARSRIHPQAGALLEGGADGIIIETMSAIEELIASPSGPPARPGRRSSSPRWPSTASQRRHPHNDGRLAGEGGIGVDRGGGRRRRRELRDAHDNRRFRRA